MPTTREDPLTAPWENWELDAHFFKTLSQWTLEHPETSLDRVLARICFAIDNGREFFEAIPDGAFPARGLVKALAHLVKLGATVSTANSEVQSFAKEVIHCVTQVGSAFTGSTGGQFTRETWKNLADMRDLIDEICKWAVLRLSDRRWSLTGLKNKLRVKTEVNEFKARIVEARAILNERSIISQASGIDAILQWIWKLLKGQRRIESTLSKIRATQARHLVYVLQKIEADEAEEAKRREAEERRQYVAQMLAKHTATNISYDEQGKPPCDKDTRVDVLKEIMGWVEDTTPDSQNFLWLTGDPGCGKSAVTASVARECKDKGFLWAQFFINRNNVDTTNPNSYFPSIARQLAARSDRVEHEIHDRLKAKPSLVDGMSSDQATALFIDAIRVASRLYPATPAVIVIDGLDETDRRYLRTTADIFAHLFTELSNHSNAKVFISSRTEDDIRNPFARTMNNKSVKHIHLDTSAESCIQDVAMFLRRRVARIVLDHDLDWRLWPGDERMDMLAMQASGLFIWAATAANFIRDEIESWGTECLDDVLDKLNSDGMGDINTLYGVILSTTYKQRADAWAFESFRRLIGAIVVLHEPLCLDEISKLLGLQRSSSSRQVDVVRLVKRLRTVLVAGTGAIDGQTIPRLHKSFFEFVTSGDRVESHFHIETKLSHRELGFQCLYQFALASSATASIRMPGSFRYAVRFWSRHLLQGLGTASGVAIADNTLNLSEFQSILQQSSNKDRAAPISVTLSRDRSHIQASLGHRIRTWDTASGIDQAVTFKSEPILDLSTQTHPTVTFLPDGNHVAWASWGGCIGMWNTQSGEFSKVPFHSHFSHAAFSLDRSSYVAGSEDGHFCVCDIHTGQPVAGSFYRGPSSTSAGTRSNSVSCMAFSPTGLWAAAGYSDGTLQFWNPEIVTSHGLSVQGHRSGARAIAFSPDGGHVLSCSEDGTIVLWDIQSSTEIHQVQCLSFQGHTQGVMALAFSPDGQLAVSGSADQTIRFWDVQRGVQVGPSLCGHAGAVRSVDFSPDGKQIVSGSDDQTVRFWDVHTKRAIGAPLRGHTGSVHSVAYSPDGNRICSGSKDTLRIWTPINPLQDDFQTSIIAFSPSGEQIVSVSHDSRIRLWNTRTERPNGLLLKGKIPAQPIGFVSFSCDGSQIAASTSDTISLWDAGTGHLIDSHEVGSPASIVGLHFTRDNKTLVTAIGAGTSFRYEEKNGRRIVSHREVSQTERALYFFDVNEDQWLDHDMAPRTMRWFSSNNPDHVLWAIIDNHIIRARKDGDVMVVPVTVIRDRAIDSDISDKGA